MASELKTAAQIAQVLANTKLAGVTKNQANKYWSLPLNIRKKYIETLLNQKDLL